MKHWRPFAIAAALLTLGAIFACTVQPPSNPSQTNVNQNVNVNIGTQPSPGPSASPGTGQPIDHVSIFSVGDQESGGQKCVSTDPHVLHVGCTRRYTCTPKYRDGTDVPEVVHGPAPDFFAAAIGSNLVSLSELGAFDRDVKGTGAGAVVLRCDVKGVTGRPYDITLLN